MQLQALVAFEYAITFDREINTAWARRLSPASVLLVSTRWCLLAAQIVGVIPATPHVNFFVPRDWLILAKCSHV